MGKQQGLGRPEARCAAFIPIRKNAAWWNMTQDERREILEEQSRHIRIGMNYLPAELRASPEWAFVDREVEIRLILAD